QFLSSHGAVAELVRRWSAPDRSRWMDSQQSFFPACRCSSVLIVRCWMPRANAPTVSPRSEEHTSELQSLACLVCRLLLEKKNQATQPPAEDRGARACTRRREVAPQKGSLAPRARRRGPRSACQGAPVSTQAGKAALAQRT